MNTQLESVAEISNFQYIDMFQYIETLCNDMFQYVETLRVDMFQILKY